MAQIKFLAPELIHRITTAAYFDRLTEAAGLQLEN
jgi:hypothetical protein